MAYDFGSAWWGLGIDFFYDPFFSMPINPGQSAKEFKNSLIRGLGNIRGHRKKDANSLLHILLTFSTFDRYLDRLTRGENPPPKDAVSQDQSRRFRFQPQPGKLQILMSKIRPLVCSGQNYQTYPGSSRTNPDPSIFRIQEDQIDYQVTANRFPSNKFPLRLHCAHLCPTRQHDLTDHVGKLRPTIAGKLHQHIVRIQRSLLQPRPHP